MRWVLIVFALALFAGSSRAAHAQTAPNDLLDRAQRADDLLRFGEALALYDEARAVAKTSPRAAHAETRAASLRAHAEGSFGPLVALERVRRDPARGSDPAAIASLLQAADTFPPGLVRIESWQLAADANAQRLDRPRDAEPLLARIIADPLADRVTVANAARELVALTSARGDLAAAAHVAEGDPVLTARVARIARRRLAHDASLLALGALAAFALVALGRAARRREVARVRAAVVRSGPVLIAYCIYIAAFGALLATGFEAGTASPFLWLGAGLAPLLFVSRAWAAAGSETGASRLGRAALSGASALATAFLVLEHLDVSYLAGVGL